MFLDGQCVPSRGAELFCRPVPVVYIKDQRPATDLVQCRQNIAGHGPVHRYSSNKLATLSFKNPDSRVRYLVQQAQFLMRSFLWAGY